MSRALRTVALVVVVVGLVILPCAAVWSETEEDLEVLKCDPERYLATLSTLFSKAINNKDFDSALALLDYYDPFPLCPDAARYRLLLALHYYKEQGKPTDTVARLVQKIVDLDPYSSEGPVAMKVLIEVLENEGRLEEANALRHRLATEYFPTLPSVADARRRPGQQLPFIPASRMILLEGSLGEFTVFNRCATGSCTLGQFEVLKTLVEAGYVVHTNAQAPEPPLCPELIAQYGLIVLHGNPGTTKPPIPQSAIETLANYVKAGGSLLVICSGTSLGGGKMAQYYNPLMSRFRLHFAEGSVIREKGSLGAQSDKDAAPKDYGGKPAEPNPANLSDFYVVGGTAVSSEKGTVLGYCDDQPVIVVVRHGKGRVVAAGVGTALCGVAMCQPDDPKIAQMGRKLLLQITSYMLSSTR